MPELKPRSKIVARGTTNFTLVSVQADVVLARPMPNNNYKVYTRQISGLSVNLPLVTNQNTTGFRLSIGVGVVATVEWIAIED